MHPVHFMDIPSNGSVTMKQICWSTLLQNFIPDFMWSVTEIIEKPHCSHLERLVHFIAWMSFNQPKTFDTWLHQRHISTDEKKPNISFYISLKTIAHLPYKFTVYKHAGHVWNAIFLSKSLLFTKILLVNCACAGKYFFTSASVFTNDDTPCRLLVLSALWLPPSLTEI